MPNINFWLLTKSDWKAERDLQMAWIPRVGETIDFGDEPTEEVAVKEICHRPDVSYGRFVRIILEEVSEETFFQIVNASPGWCVDGIGAGGWEKLEAECPTQYNRESHSGLSGKDADKKNAADPPRKS